MTLYDKDETVDLGAAEKRALKAGQEGFLVADLDLSTATGLLASRCRTTPI